MLLIRKKDFYLEGGGITLNSTLLFCILPFLLSLFAIRSNTHSLTAAATSVADQYSNNQLYSEAVARVALKTVVARIVVDYKLVRVDRHLIRIIMAEIIVTLVLKTVVVSRLLTHEKLVLNTVAIMVVTHEKLVLSTLARKVHAVAALKTKQLIHVMLVALAKTVASLQLFPSLA